jgi:hypothetical protein
LEIQVKHFGIVVELKLIMGWNNSLPAWMNEVKTGSQENKILLRGGGVGEIFLDWKSK